MSVSTRVVFAGSAGSSEPNSRIEIVVIEFEKELQAREVEASEVVLAMRIVIAVERVERRDRSDRHRAHVARQIADADGQQQAAESRIEGLSKRVVEIANAFASLFISERHVLLHAIDASSWCVERRRGAFRHCTRGGHSVERSSGRSPVANLLLQRLRSAGNGLASCGIRDGGLMARLSVFVERPAETVTARKIGLDRDRERMIFGHRNNICELRNYFLAILFRQHKKFLFGRISKNRHIITHLNANFGTMPQFMAPRK